MDFCNLADKNCKPCQGGVPALDEAQAKEMLGQIKGWSLQNGAQKLYKEFKFNNFTKALAFTNKLGEVAEEEGHHPDLALGWGYVHVTVQTHSLNGLTESDFVLAAKADRIFTS